MASFMDRFRAKMRQATLPGNVVARPEKPVPLPQDGKPEGIRPYPAGFKAGMTLDKKKVIVPMTGGEQKMTVQAIRARRIVPSRDIEPKVGWGNKLFSREDGFDFTESARNIAKAKLEYENILRQVYDPNTKSFRVSCINEF
jgi:hypothetical protein